MKNINKFIFSLLALSLFFVNINVFAREYSVDELIPISEEATVITNTFVYNGIKFTNDKNNKMNGMVTFRSISNNTSSKISPSIGILLFDSNMKNIGYINYCASKDYDSDNSHVQISGHGSIAFDFGVSPRYLGANEENFEGKVHDSSAIAYYSIHDDNKHCQIGGYVKYYGFTIEEITSKKIYKDELELSDIILYLRYFLIALVALIGYGLLLNTVYKRMHARTSILSYFPLTNLYIAVKLAFGKKIAWIFYILCIASFVITYNSSNMTFTWLLLAFVVVSTIIDIVKLVTGKYDMFVVGKKHKNVDDSMDENFVSHSGTRFIDENDSNSSGFDQSLASNELLNVFNSDVDVLPSAPVEEMKIDSNDMVDISYDVDVPITDDSFLGVNSNDFKDISNINNNESNNNSNLEFEVSNNTLTPVSNISSSTSLENEMTSDLSSIYNLETNDTSNNITHSIPKLGEDEASGESELSNFFK